MEIVVAFIGAAIVVIVAAYVAQPLLVKTRVKAWAEDSPREKLLAERDTVYAAIRDLDFDFQTGKLLETDYHAMRDKYAARGVEILKELDALGDDRQPLTADRKQPASVDEIEAAVRARRKAKPAQSAPQEDDIEAAVRARRQSANPNQKPPEEGDSETPAPALRSGPFGSTSAENPKCPRCGRPIDPSDRFCAKCGAPLTVEATR